MPVKDYGSGNTQLFPALEFLTEMGKILDGLRER